MTILLPSVELLIAEFHNWWTLVIELKLTNTELPWAKLYTITLSHLVKARSKGRGDAGESLIIHKKG